MKKYIIKKNGQALTEFVIMIPLFLLLFSSMFQLSILVIKRVELAMLEREVMRYLTSDSEDKDKEKVEEFVKECAVYCGLKKENIKYEPSNRFVTGADTVDSMGLLENVTGIKIKLIYEEKLTRVFAAITGRQSINLTTTLSTAAGSCLKFKGSDKIDKLRKGFGFDKE